MAKLFALSLSLSFVFLSMTDLEAGAKNNGNIGAYTKKSGGVTVKRNSNGTIEVMDEETVYTPHTSAGFRSGKKRSTGRVGSYVRKSADSTVKRNADGTIEVTDTSSTTRNSAVKSKSTKSSKK